MKEYEILCKIELKFAWESLSWYYFNILETKPYLYMLYYILLGEFLILLLGYNYLIYVLKDGEVVKYSLTFLYITPKSIATFPLP